MDARKTASASDQLSRTWKSRSLGLEVDMTNAYEVGESLKLVLNKFGRLDVLINNAANNPKVESNGGTNWSRFENYPMSVWQQDVAAGLIGAFLCSQVFGAQMARMRRGVILNIASDLGVIGPDQRIYRKDGLPY